MNEKSAEYFRTKSVKKQEVIDSGRLDRKRFALPKDEKLRDRLNMLQDIIKQLKQEDPAIVSLGLFGSHTKGYAREDSDIDAHIFVEKDAAIKLHPEILEGAKERWGEISDVGSRFLPTLNMIIDNKVESYYGEIMRNKAKENIQLSDEQVGHFFVYAISELGLKNECNADEIAIDYMHLKNLFHMAVGSSDIRKYRKVVIDELEKQGEKGEEKWQAIMQALHKWERKDIDLVEDYNSREFGTYKNREKYPQTLAEAKKYFL